MSALTYQPDTAAAGVRYVDCPKCGYGARVDLYGQRLSVRCQGSGCSEEEVLAGLDTEGVIAELR